MSTARAVQVLFGGTFDPVHIGHLRVALEARELLVADEVRFIPTGDPRHRAPPTFDAATRAGWIEAAINGVPGFAVERCEIERQGPSYTIDTLRELRGRVGPETALVFLLGLDQLAKLDQWQGWRELTEHAHLGVLNRPVEDVLPAVVRAFLAEHQRPLAAVREAPAGAIVDLSITQLKLSSSDIRARWRAGLDLRWLVPEPVRAALAERVADPDTGRRVR